MEQYSENSREEASAVRGLYSNQAVRNAAGTLTSLVMSAEVRSSVPAIEPPTRIGFIKVTLFKAERAAVFIVVVPIPDSTI
jgi:hypothetical protein